MKSRVSWINRWTVFRPHEVQYQLWRCAARFVGVPAGRRSGKTEIAKRRLVLALTQSQALARSALLLRRPYPRPGQADRLAGLLGPDPRRLDRRRQTFSQRLPRDADHPHDLRLGAARGEPRPAAAAGRRRLGRRRAGRVVGPAAEDLRPFHPPRDFPTAAAGPGGSACPSGKASGTGEYRDFCERCLAGAYPDGQCFTWPSSDILPAAEVAHARETLDAKDFREQYEASWETAGGGIFHAFQPDYNVRPCPYRPERAIVVGSDFNVDPMAWVLGHRFPDRLEWFDEIFLRNSNTPRGVERRLAALPGPSRRLGVLRRRLRLATQHRGGRLRLRADRQRRAIQAGGPHHALPPRQPAPSKTASPPATPCWKTRPASGGCSSTHAARTCWPTSNSAATSPVAASPPTSPSAAGRWATLPTPWATPSTTSSPSSSGWISRYR